MTYEEFSDAVRQAAAQLPARFKRALAEENIQILPREKMPARIRISYPGSLVFGVFVGISRKDRSAWNVPTEPTRIEIYQESFERAFGETMTDAIRQEIDRTVIHEVAHYFGFDEKEIRGHGF